MSKARAASPVVDKIVSSTREIHGKRVAKKGYFEIAGKKKERTHPEKFLP